MFEGTVLALKNGGIGETVTLRKIASGIGVERTFPLHSPNVAKFEVTRRGKVRRAKLYYLRDKVGKDARIKKAPLNRAPALSGAGQPDADAYRSACADSPEPSAAVRRALSVLQLALHPFLLRTPVHKRGLGYGLARFLNEAADALVYAGIFVFLLIRRSPSRLFRFRPGPCGPRCT